MTADHRKGNEPSAVILLSGGLDSATTLAIARDRGYQCHALTFLYGQRHAVEVESAQQIARNQGIRDHQILDLPIQQLAKSALTDEAQSIPQDRSARELTENIPATYVPARNTIFLSCALARAESTDADCIFCGVNAVDYSGYPDCRPEFIAAFQNLAQVATKKAIEGAPTKIRAPLQGMTKEEIIRTGTRLGVDYSLTSTCYNPDAEGRACGHCDACQLRKRGFEKADVPDPTEYQ